MIWNSADLCNCAEDDSKTVSLLEILCIAIGFNLVMAMTYFIFYKNSSVKDEKSE
jgi:hypothetical protein